MPFTGVITFATTTLKKEDYLSETYSELSVNCSLSLFFPQ